MNGHSQRASGRSAILPSGFANIELGGDADTRPPGLRLAAGFRYIPPLNPPHPLAVKGFPEPRLQSSTKRTLQPLPSTNRCAATVVVVVIAVAATAVR